ncbi:aminodeoxychorismate lyase [Lysobacter sp. CW239]|nr:aminodeoxychorismate lyase [Lysobacter concretionis]QOD91831.1 aminodeoxychorismate lyase [Lysobacter sp. CW239]
MPQSAHANVRIFIGTEPVSVVPPDDRALAYGDGLFETMRAHRGTVPWWDRHWARLQRGAQRLRLALPSQAQVRDEAARLLAGTDGVLKLFVSRGCGGRGYALPADPVPTWLLSLHPVPRPVSGLTLRWCDTRLAIQPVLAGIKHGNRLEQVLARAEWDDGVAADEGLMRSTVGDVVCATAANLFLLQDGQWRTPPVDRCGVAGVCRQWMLDTFDVEPVRLSVADVETADAVVLTNAVRGILPVARLLDTAPGERAWQPHPQVVEWQRRLAADHPAFTAPADGAHIMEVP